MSRLDHPLSEIHSGTHLVVVLEASLLRDKDNLPIIAKDGSKGINIRFNDNKLNHDKVFWEKSSDFRKLCKVTSCDMTKPVLPQLKGKSLWLCIKEVKTMKQGQYVSDAMIHVSSEYLAFDYIECTNPTQKPIISGDPCQHPKGLPLGVFVEYKEAEKTNWVPVEQINESLKNIPQGEFTQEQIEMSDVVFGANQKTGKAINGDKNLELTHQILFQTPAPEDYDGQKINLKHTDEFPMFPELTEEQKQKLELGKKIIAEGEGKKMTSLNEKNTPKETAEEKFEQAAIEQDIFDKAESHGESNDNNHVEDDWSKL